MEKQNKGNDSVKTIGDLDLSGMDENTVSFIKKHTKEDDGLDEAFSKLAGIASNSDKKVNEQGLELGFLRKKNDKLEDAISALEGNEEEEDSTKSSEKESITDVQIDKIVERLDKLDELDKKIDGMEQRIEKNLSSKLNRNRSKEEKIRVINDGLAKLEQNYGEKGKELADTLVNRNSKDPADSPLLGIMFNEGLSALWDTPDPFGLSVKLLIPAGDLAKLESSSKSETAGRGAGAEKGNSIADEFFGDLPEDVRI